MLYGQSGAIFCCTGSQGEYFVVWAVRRNIFLYGQSGGIFCCTSSREEHFVVGAVGRTILVYRQSGGLFCCTGSWEKYFVVWAVRRSEEYFVVRAVGSNTLGRSVGKIIIVILRPH